MYAPEIVIIEKGDAVAGLQKRTISGKLLLLLAFSAIIFGVGYSLGRIWMSRHEHNYAIDAAKKIKNQIDKMGSERQAIVKALSASNERIAQTKINAPDMQLISDLDASGFQAGDPHDLYAPNYNFLGNEEVREIVDYYVFTEKLALAVQRHVLYSKQDSSEFDEYENSLKESAAAQQAGGDSGQFGIVFDTTKPFSVGLLAEVGQPVCKDGSLSCQQQDMTSMQVRTALGAPWDVKSLDPKAKDAERVILLDKTSALFQSVLHGGPVITAVRNYQQRNSEILQLLNQLQLIENDLDKKLGDDAAKPKLFVF